MKRNKNEFIILCNGWEKRSTVTDLSGIKTGTYEDAEWRRAGWKGCEKLQYAETWFSHIEVVVSSALLTAELLQSPPLCTIRRMLCQRSHERLTERQKVKVKSANCSATPSLGETLAIPTCTKTPKTQNFHILALIHSGLEIHSMTG